MFLLARMREAYVHGENPNQAVVTGLKYSGRVVAAAAAIMMAVFAVFAVFIGSGEPMIRMIGFGLAIAVFQERARGHRTRTSAIALEEASADRLMAGYDPAGTAW